MNTYLISYLVGDKEENVIEIKAEDIEDAEWNGIQMIDMLHDLNTNEEREQVSIICIEDKNAPLTPFFTH